MQPNERFEVHNWREFGEALGGTFTFLRQNIRELLKSLVFIPGPVLLVVGMVMGFVFRDYFSMTFQVNTGPFLDDEFWETWFITVGLQYLFTFISYSVVSITVFEFIQIYAHKPDKQVTMEEVWKGVKRDFLKLMAAKLIMSPLIIVCLLCFYLPGIAVYTLLGAVEIIMIEKKVGPFKGISGSFEIMGKYFWMGLGLVVVTFIIQGLAGMVIQAPVAIVEALEGVAAIEAVEGSAWDIFLSVLGGFSQVVGYALYAVPTTALGLLYYAAVEHKEGRMLKARIAKIGRDKPDLDIFHEDEQY